jgi:hypothetical protein
MSWSDQIFAYCERGTDPGFWAEPLNAISNAAFLVAAAFAYRQWKRTSRGNAGAIELALVGLVLAIGIGSFVFHTLATRWARIADTGPIGVFMLAYLAYALRRYVGCRPIVVAAALAAFLGLAALSASATCGGRACVNGSLGYLPALLALAVVGIAVARRGHPAGRALLQASGVFAVSLLFRSIDMAACPGTLIQPGWRSGTHAAWHVLNAVVLYILLVAAVRHGTAAAATRKD